MRRGAGRRGSPECFCIQVCSLQHPCAVLGAAIEPIHTTNCSRRHPAQWQNPNCITQLMESTMSMLTAVLWGSQLIMPDGALKHKQCPFETSALGAQTSWATTYTPLHQLAMLATTTPCTPLLLLAAPRPHCGTQSGNQLTTVSTILLLLQLHENLLHAVPHEGLPCARALEEPVLLIAACFLGMCKAGDRV